MAARSIASLTVSFGLVSIPVKLYSATEASRAMSFNLLHKSCGSRLRQQYFCVKEDVPVGREDMVKGYEFAKDQYVMFTPEELKALEEAGTHTAEITEFVPAKTIDPVYFDKAYYLGPDKGGAKPYALLARALKETGRCALGRWAARGKQYIVMIRPHEEGLLLEQLYYADEIRSFDEVPLEEGEVNQAELGLAKQLIDQAAAEKFDPTQFHDEVREKTLELIQKKIEGQEITAAPAEESKTKIIDLMAKRGRIVVMAGRQAQPTFPVGPFYVKDLSLCGFAMFNASQEEQRACAEDINRWLAENRTVEGVWYGWGAYLWAPACTDGIANAAGICYVRSDFVEDGVHPSASGRAKIAQAMHERLLAHRWYRR